MRCCASESVGVRDGLQILLELLRQVWRSYVTPSDYRDGWLFARLNIAWLRPSASFFEAEHVMNGF
jgi:hypothetical protein